MRAENHYTAEKIDIAGVSPSSKSARSFLSAANSAETASSSKAVCTSSLVHNARAPTRRLQPTAHLCKTRLAHTRVCWPVDSLRWVWTYHALLMFCGALLARVVANVHYMGSQLISAPMIHPCWRAALASHPRPCHVDDTHLPLHLSETQTAGALALLVLVMVSVLVGESEMHQYAQVSFVAVVDFHSVVSRQPPQRGTPHSAWSEVRPRRSPRGQPAASC